MDKETDARIYQYIGSRSLINGRHDQANLNFKRFAKLNSHQNNNSSNAYCHWGWTLYHQRKFPQAIRKYKIAVQCQDKFTLARVYERWGLCLLKMREFDEAIEKFNKMLENSPLSRAVDMNIVLALMLKGDEEKALKVLDNRKTKKNILIEIDDLIQEYEEGVLWLEMKLEDLVDMNKILFAEEEKKQLKLLISALQRKKQEIRNAEKPESDSF